MNCLLIEDEPLAMLRLSEYVRRVPFLHLAHAVDNGWDALTILKNEKIDLIFLDVEMDDVSGIQLLDALPARPPVILTTAFDHYALKAFDLKVSDYLLKPYTFDRFLQAVIRVQETGVGRSNDPKTYLFVKSEYRLVKILFDDILYIEGMRDYRRICLKNEKIMTLETFGQLEQQLPVTQFCRVHKSYLVALNKIESVERDRIMIQKSTIPVSLTYREMFYQLIGRSEKLG
ncbi:LytTR family DNA-binding domain-containing protein [Dyadobacter sp. CY107]|uniref:LytR/AlgR family response regulator transcription factor n=1 Tax=Dyadobacter fanqingshengii TaxID=2906443 RepID=UPI001F2B5D85|nr:LytTR family DNA-binding domain-containing protein [Dyadobacter fanqingshengii]MCF2506007.1 LytTR family DNA-binding domain-containing protein [Dyadobacter fanqingshengii]